MNNNRITKDLFGTLQNLYVFIENFPKQHVVYLEQQRMVNQASDEEETNREYALKKLSDTKWSTGQTALKHSITL